jgi:hypothetical protein
MVLGDSTAPAVSRQRFVHAPCSHLRRCSKRYMYQPVSSLYQIYKDFSAPGRCIRIRLICYFHRSHSPHSQCPYIVDLKCLSKRNSVVYLFH